MYCRCLEAGTDMNETRMLQLLTAKGNKKEETKSVNKK